MGVRELYNQWADQYDTNHNRTRDLEAKALRQTLDNITFNSCIEAGCGTGKNTEWLNTRAKQVLSVDFSESMLQKARERISSPTVQFLQADISMPWNFTTEKFELCVFSLVLEHIENLDMVFQHASDILKPGGFLYAGELHPFKQYAGSKARFEDEKGVQSPDCFTHHFSDFIQAATKAGLVCIQVQEYFDEDNRQELPRILVMLFQKPS